MYVVKKQGFSGSNDPWFGKYDPTFTGVNLKDAIWFPVRRIALSASICIILLAKRLGFKGLYSPSILEIFPKTP